MGAKSCVQYLVRQTTDTQGGFNVERKLLIPNPSLQPGSGENAVCIAIACRPHRLDAWFKLASSRRFTRSLKGNAVPKQRFLYFSQKGLHREAQLTVTTATLALISTCFLGLDCNDSTIST